MNTLAQLKASRLGKVLGICPDTSDFLEYANEAMERLAHRGNWKGTFQRMRLCLTEGCITLPRIVESFQTISLCAEPVRVVNQFYEFLPNGNGLAWNNGCDSWCGDPMLIDRGYFPTTSDIRGTKTIRLYYTVSSDIGKRVLIQGYDANGIWIRSVESGTTIDGFYMTLTDPFIDSSFTLTSITGIQKDVTNGDVLLYEVDTDGSQRLLGRFEPSETVVSRRRYFYKGLEDHGDCCTDCDTKTVVGIAKLKFIPVSVNTDYLYIPNIPAIMDMVRSIYFYEKDTPTSQAQGTFFERKAIAELNHQKETDSPKSQIGARTNPYGSAALRKQRIGSLT